MSIEDKEYDPYTGCQVRKVLVELRDFGRQLVIYWQYRDRTPHAHTETDGQIALTREQAKELKAQLDAIPHFYWE
jgi:uncharacterized protein YeaC (DUF1315 family)